VAGRIIGEAQGPGGEVAIEFPPDAVALSFEARAVQHGGLGLREQRLDAREARLDLR
jgi:hypothetical protein